LVRRLLSAVRVRIFVLAGGLLSITGTAAVSQDAFEAALTTLPGEVREVNSAGRWRTADAGGVYRVIVLRGGYERIADRLYIQWVRDGAADQQPRVIRTRFMQWQRTAYGS
jgi:hypothetical protein